MGTDITSNLESLVNSVEQDLFYYMIASAKQNRITLEESQTLAKDFLAILPVNSKEELLEKLLKLGEKYSEVKSVYLKYAAPYEEEKARQAVDEMKKLIHKRDFLGAAEVAKKATE